MAMLAQLEGCGPPPCQQPRFYLGSGFNVFHVAKQCLFIFVSWIARFFRSEGIRRFIIA
jgi:hypothetical protein